MFFSIANSTIISKAEYTLYPTDNNTYNEISIDYKEITTNKLSYLHIGKIYNFSSYYTVNNTIHYLNCSKEENNVGTQLLCNVPYKKNLNILFTFNSLDVRRIVEDTYEVSYTITITSPTESMDVFIFLPEGAYIADRSKLESILPEGYKIGIDEKGRHIIVSWNNVTPLLGKRYTFNVMYELVKKEDKRENIKDEENKRNNNYLYIIISLVLSAIIYIIYLKFHSKKIKKQKVIEVLMEDELKVLNTIKELGNGCKQKDVVKNTGFSKAKVSRIIEDLRKRGILKVERVGKINKLYIIEE